VNGENYIRRTFIIYTIYLISLEQTHYVKWDWQGIVTHAGEMRNTRFYLEKFNRKEHLGD
jgi:hypothetical protein